MALSRTLAAHPRVAVSKTGGKGRVEGDGRGPLNAYREFGADRVVAEVNNGGDLVEDVLRVIDKKRLL
jgi:phage terminase large subunit-like protein